LFLYNTSILNEQDITGYAVSPAARVIPKAVLVLSAISIIMSLSSTAFYLGTPKGDNIKKLLSNISVALANNETSSARMMYIQLRNSYNKLQKGDKEKHHAECMKLYQRLVNQMLAK
jgi:hypothetical protein